MHTLWKHEKSGGVYELLTFGINEADLVPVAIYRNSAGLVWVRPVDEFMKRFKPHITLKE